MSTKGTNDKSKNYYGTIAGVVCAGPVDELVSLIIDGRTVWPADKGWADDVVDLPAISVKRVSNLATVKFAAPHRLNKNGKFVLTGLPDSSFNDSSPRTAGSTTALTVSFANTGSNVSPPTAVSSGVLTKVVHYAVNDVVRYQGTVWKCISAHDGTPDKAPPNGTYWQKISVLRSGSDNPYPFTVKGFGQCYFYWGTDDQVLDTTDEITLAQNGHPPYRHQAVLVLKDFLFGTERQGPPNIEVVVRRTPAQSIIEGDAAELDADYQANPLAAGADLLADAIFGLGKVSFADGDSWSDTAGALAAVPGRTSISPLLNGGVSARSFFAMLLAYYDGWFRFVGGAIEAGRFLHNELPPVFTDATTIDSHDLVEEIQFDSAGLAETYNETVTKFQDRLRAFKDAAQMAVSSYNRALTGEPRRVVLDRPWIVREQQANDYAAEWAKINGQPKVSGSLVVRLEKTTSIKQGDLFLLTHDALQLSLVCRCVEKSLAAPPAGRATLRFESERGVAPLPYKATASLAGTDPFAPPQAVSIYRFVQPPPDLSPGSAEYELVVLAARVSAIERGLRPWLQVDDDDLFYQLGEQRDWAVKGTLAQDYDVTGTDDDSENLRLNLDEATIQADLEKVMADQSADALNNSAMLVWLFSAADPTHFEICALKAIRLNSGVYKLKVRRGRFATLLRAFDEGDEAWIIPRTEVVTYVHDKFSEYSTAGSPATFRLQGFTGFEAADLSDADVCPDIDFTFTDPHLPIVTWTIIKKKATGDSDFASITDFTAYFDASTLFWIGMRAQSPGILKKIELVGTLGHVQQLLAAREEPTLGFTASLVATPFKFGSNGTWSVLAIVTQKRGRVTVHELTYSSAVVQLNIGSTAVVATPTCTPAGGGFREEGITPGTPPYVPVTLACATSGADIYWYLTPVGNATPDKSSFFNDSTTPLGGGIALYRPNTPFQYSEVWLWLFGRKSGKTDSDLVFYEFWWQV